MKWISVEDRLPQDSERDKYGRVLAVNDLKSVITIVFDSAWQVWPNQRRVLYWMPLPEPPNENE